VRPTHHECEGVKIEVEIACALDFSNCAFFIFQYFKNLARVNFFLNLLHQNKIIQVAPINLKPQILQKQIQAEHVKKKTPLNNNKMLSTTTICPDARTKHKLT
jgi:hypothetical protein